MGKEKLLRFIPVLVICGLFSLLSVALVGQQFYGRYTPREKMIDVLPAGSFQVEGADSDAECLVLVNSKEANSVMASAAEVTSIAITDKGIYHHLTNP